MGPKNVLEILEIQSICDENEWILSILEKYIVGASLQFFLSDILGIVKAVEKGIPKVYALFFLKIYCALQNKEDFCVELYSYSHTML